jgi:hypothetical protein
VRPAPQFEPPYDDEAAHLDHGPTHDDHEATPTGGAAAAPAPEPEAHRPAHARPQQRPAPAHAAGGAPPRMSNGGRAAYRYVALCLEVLDGFRPVGQLRRLTVPAAFDAVAGQLARPTARAGHRRVGEAPGTNRPRPAQGGPAGPAPPWAAPADRRRPPRLDRRRALRADGVRAP